MILERVDYTSCVRITRASVAPAGNAGATVPSGVFIWRAIIWSLFKVWTVAMLVKLLPMVTWFSQNFFSAILVLYH